MDGIGRRPPRGKRGRTPERRSQKRRGADAQRQPPGGENADRNSSTAAHARPQTAREPRGYGLGGRKIPARAGSERLGSEGEAKGPATPRVKPASAPDSSGSSEVGRGGAEGSGTAKAASGVPEQAQPWHGGDESDLGACSPGMLR